ncbi:MAG: hypothetical protein EOP56_08365 [Sphingobacteriales bacterium]|nr:MAG: hypothetical protein EOP56_08365 [Sphingobacteriales bacterium]
MPRLPIVGFTSLICSSLAFFSPDLHAQNGLKDSRELITKGIKLFDEKKYKEALTYFSQVPEGDTNFSTAKYEVALAYLADSSFERSKQVSLEALKLPESDRRQLLYLVAHAYDYMGKTDSAVYYYDSLARTYPTDNLAYYEKSVVYFQKRDFDKALPLLEKALLMNPYHYRSHAVLGSIYMQQGRFAEAYMASAAALLFANDINIARGAIGTLSSITNQTKEVSDYYDQRAEGLDLYAEIDEIIHAKLALNSAYKVPSVMGEDQVVRVAHAIMEKLTYDESSKNFAMHYYVPLFRDIYRKEMFDPFILLLFSGYGIDVVENYAKKQKRDISEVRGFVYPYWDDIVQTRKLNYAKRANAPVKYLYSQSENSYTVGNLVKGKEGLEFKEGKVSFYSGGYLKAEGDFNNAGKKEGEWKYFYHNGIVSLTEQYKNGVIQGEAREYRTNGHLKSVHKYDNDGTQTEEHEYTYNGILDNVTKVLADKERSVTYYHLNGRKQNKLKIKDGLVMDGNYKSHYSNGSLEKEMEIVDGKLNGAYKEYYENGKLKEQATYRKGDRDGIYTTYYENGQKESELNYTRGKADGILTNYDEKGKVSGKVSFKDGKRDGLDIVMTDGREFSIIDYKNNIPVGYRFIGPDGKEIKEASKKLSSLKLYHPNGNLRSDLPLKDGKIHGQAKYYFNTGKLREVVAYEDDEKNGTSTEYYRSGKTQMVSEYVKGERTGWYKGYYGNGKLSGEGALIDDKKEGVWRFYNVAGKLEREAFYLNNEENGPSKHFDGDGKLRYMDYYDRGLIVRMEQYDASGKIIHQQIYPLGTGKYYFVYPNGNMSFEAQMKNGKYEGAYTSYYPDKSVKETGYYVNNERDSLMVSYFPGGQEQSRGYFRNGKREGRWVSYDFDGKLARETNYLHGNEHGRDKMYHHGELRADYNMDADYMDEDQTFYGEENKIALVYSYKGHDLVGYTYTGQDGKLQPLTLVKNGTGKVITYYPNGKKAVELNLVDNMYDGKMTNYYSNGNLAEEKTYVGTELNGVFKRFFPNGKPAYEATYKDDALNGEEKLYGENGKLLIHAKHVMGEQHGVQLYNEPRTGKSYKLTYDHGELLTIETI